MHKIDGYYSTAIDVWLLTKDNVKPELLQRWSWSPKTLWGSLREGGQ